MSEPGTGESSPSSNGLPLLSESTRTYLKDEMEYTDYLRGYRHWDPFKIRDFTARVMEKLVENNRQLGQDLNSVFNEREISGWNRSSFEDGIALVLGAFDFESQGALMESLRGLDEHDLATVREHFLTTTPPKESSSLQKALARPAIPDEQIVLNEAIKFVSHDHPAVKDGASVTYHLLAKLGPKLKFKPDAGNPPPQAPLPPTTPAV